MLYFVIMLALGVLAVLAVQMADIEGVKTKPVIPASIPARPAAKRQDDRRRLPLGELAQQ